MVRKDLALSIVRGGWPSSLSLPEKSAAGVASEYLHSLENSDFVHSDDKRIKRNPEKIMALVKSFARNTATTVSIETIISDSKESGIKVSRAAVDSYLRDMHKRYVVFDQPAWKGEMRSRAPLRQNPKRHLAHRISHSPEESIETDIQV
jgi:predicted AAA+ superfamily ATPase